MATKGALTQRKFRARHKGKTPPKHDAHSYSNWSCRCEVCRSDWKIVMRLNRENRKIKGPPYHGHPRGNADYGCTCDPCLVVRRLSRRKKK